MLIDALHRIVAHPRVYNFVQTICGARQSREKLKNRLADIGACVVLDIGAGTGNGLRVLPAEAQYLWLDNDSQKLAGFMPYRCCEAILASATAIPLAAGSVDVALCIAMTHHLTDTQMMEVLTELRRVCRNRLILLDAVERRGSLISGLLWRLDRGSHPRSSERLRNLVRQHFDIQFEEEYSIYHAYWLCDARVKRRGDVGTSSAPVTGFQEVPS